MTYPRTCLHVLTVCMLLWACKQNEADESRVNANQKTYKSVSREDFNRRAAYLALPLFWSEDRSPTGSLDPQELEVFWGLDNTNRDDWVSNGVFTEKFDTAYVLIAQNPSVPSNWSSAERKRQEALQQELSQGYLTTLASDFLGASNEDRTVVTHMQRAARIIERLYAKQVGSLGLEEQIPKQDHLSRFVFFLNHGPWCSGPQTEDNPNCTALSNKPKRISGLYPEDLQSDKNFCDLLQKLPNSDVLTNPFTVVEKDDQSKLIAKSYAEVYKDDMLTIAKELRAAAKAIEHTDENAFHTYLLAAAKAFEDNHWHAADEAWSKMNAENSKWYLRVGPDEVYFEPCNLKAGFHMSFATINKASLAWQKRLNPVQQDMEKALAAYAGRPYKARKVSIHMPDFIDIILNAGDSRNAFGATIGQSLPNWGPVANEGRGRTVVMTNFYTDPESRRILRAQAASLLCPDTMETYVDEQDAQLLGIVLHEVAHNLGPSHEYRVRGKTDDQIFGGPMASVLEELKAQTSALFFTDWLVEKDIISKDLAKKAHTRDIVWALGHISRGFYANGKPKPYSQLAAIQVGFLLKHGGLKWQQNKKASDPTYTGCFSLQHDQLTSQIKQITRMALGIKARGDIGAAKALQKEFVDDEGRWQTLVGTITERWQKYPRASFLYAVRM